MGPFDGPSRTSSRCCPAPRSRLRWGTGRSGAVGPIRRRERRPAARTRWYRRPSKEEGLASMTTRVDDPGALVIPPATIVPGRARSTAPLRREGPAKLTGVALYTDDIVVPGAWFGATIRSTDAHATFDALELDPSFDWSSVVVVTAVDIPGENVVSSIKSDQPILVPVGGEIQHHAEPLALVAAPDKATLREA